METNSDNIDFTKIKVPYSLDILVKQIEHLQEQINELSAAPIYYIYNGCSFNYGENCDITNTFTQEDNKEEN